METVNIKERKENPLLEREEIECIINFDGPTPSKEAIKELIAKSLMANIDLITINKILQQFGLRQVIVYGCVYKTKDAKAAVEKTEKSETEGKERKEEKTEEEKGKAEAS